MAKRARGSTRPGQRRPIERRPATSSPAVAGSASAAAAPRPGGLTEEEARRAAELETALLAEERAADAARARTKERSVREVTPGGSLALRAEEEYAYVARDVRRIAKVGSLLFAVLIGLWVLIDVAKVFSIG